MNSEQQVKRHLDQLSKGVCFLDSDFRKVQPLTSNGGPQSGNWGGCRFVSKLPAKTNKSQCATQRIRKMGSCFSLMRSGKRSLLERKRVSLMFSGRV